VPAEIPSPQFSSGLKPNTYVCHSDAERWGIVRSELRLLSKHVVYTEFFGVADSSAAFGVGMTRTIEQGDPESFFSKL
jgi:hypothetical protein